MAAAPEWLVEFANSIALNMTPTDVMSPLGCHFCHVDGHWEIALFAADTEIVGGRKDGMHRGSRFSLDVLAATRYFTRVTSITWQALPFGSYDELGAHIAVEGMVGEEEVWLRVLSRAPERFNPGRLARVYELAWEEMW